MFNTCYNVFPYLEHVMIKMAEPPLLMIKMAEPPLLKKHKHPYAN
jgi:hypothetical protein